MGTTTEARPFIEALQAKQRETGLSNGQFARSLGLSPSGYWRVLKGQRGVTLHLVQAVVRKYPDLTIKALSFLS